MPVVGCLHILFKFFLNCTTVSLLLTNINMELLTPGTGLIIWQLLVFLAVLLFLVAWIIILVSKKLDPRERLSWMLGTLFLPIVGPVIFFFQLARAR